MQNLNAFQAASLLTAVEVVADTAAKLGNNDARFFDGYNNAVLYAGYNLEAFILSKVLKNNSIAITTAYWNAMTTLTHTLVGTLAFGEVLEREDFFGIGLIIAGIFLLRRK